MCADDIRVGAEIVHTLGEWCQEVVPLVQDLRSTAGLRAVVLTGSYARGTYSPHSDIDLWVVHDHMGCGSKNAIKKCSN